MYIELIEKVQRRATKLISHFKNYTCEDKLRLLNATSLETRRLVGDLIMVFKIFKGFDNLDPLMFF